MAIVARRSGANRAVARRAVQPTLPAMTHEHKGWPDQPYILSPAPLARSQPT